jgi:hypothetical protein
MLKTVLMLCFKATKLRKFTFYSDYILALLILIASSTLNSDLSIKKNIYEQCKSASD